MDTIKKFIINAYFLSALAMYPIFKDIISIMDETQLIL